LFPFDFGFVLLFFGEKCLLEAKYCHKFGDRLKQNGKLVSMKAERQMKVAAVLAAQVVETLALSPEPP